MKIKKAILPVAGFGTRFLPATKAQPKEMLTIVDKPVVQYLVEEAVASGIEEIIFVTGRGKHAIENHFDSSLELEYNLVEKEEHNLLAAVQEIANLAKFSYVRQPVPLGDGHAILCAKHLVENDEAVAVMFGDDIIDNEVPALKQLMDVYDKYKDPVIALHRVPREEVSKFGVIDGVELGDRTHEIRKFVEKPKVEEAPSNLAVVGKYIITRDTFAHLEKIQKNKGEMRLANAFINMTNENLPVYGYEVEGTRYDCGDKFGLIQAIIQTGLKHPEIKDKLQNYLKEIKL